MKRSVALTALSGAALALCAVSAQAGCYQPGGKPPLHPVIMPSELLSKSQKPANTDSIVGLWHASHYVNGSLLFDSLDQWFGDGNEIEFANIAPATGDLCLGVWTMSGKSVSLWHTGWTFNSDGSPSGTMVLTETLKVSTGGTTFKGPFDVKFYDVDGNLLQDLSGKTTAERLPGN